MNAPYVLHSDPIVTPTLFLLVGESLGQLLLPG